MVSHSLACFIKELPSKLWVTTWPIEYCTQSYKRFSQNEYNDINYFIRQTIEIDSFNYLCTSGSHFGSYHSDVHLILQTNVSTLIYTFNTFTTYRSTQYIIHEIHIMHIAIVNTNYAEYFQYVLSCIITIFTTYFPSLVVEDRNGQSLTIYINDQHPLNDNDSSYSTLPMNTL